MQGTERRFLAGQANAFTSGKVVDGQLQVIPLVDGMPRTGTALPDHLDAAEALLQMYNAQLLPTGPATTWRLLFLLHVIVRTLDPQRLTPSPKVLPKADHKPLNQIEI